MLDKKLTFGGAFIMAKYSYEEKKAAIDLVLLKGLSQSEASRITGVTRSLLQTWLNLYSHFGIEGLLMKSGTYDGEFKVNVIEYMHENKISLTQTAALFGIPGVSTVLKWERIYYEEGPQGLYRDKRGRPQKMNSKNPQKPTLNKETEEDLIAEVQRLRMENEYLKKLNALVQERIARENGNELPSSMN